MQSVTLCINEIKLGGNEEAARLLWERYFTQLVQRARRILLAGDVPRARADEEDIAASAFETLYRRLQQGKFPDLTDRDDLWAMLVAITRNKARSQKTFEGAMKRGDGRGIGEGPLLVVVGHEPSPDQAADLVDLCRRVRDLLPDVDYRRIFELKLQGYLLKEIAAETGWSERSVKRKLSYVREVLEGCIDGA